MTIFKTFEYALKPDESQKKAINQLIDRSDYVYNQLSDMANNLFGIGASVGEIKIRINKLSVDPCICNKEAEELRKQIFIQLDKMGSGEQSYISHKSLHQRKRRMRLSGAVIYDQSVWIPNAGLIEMVLHRPLPENANIFSVVLREDCYGSRFRLSLGIVYDEYLSQAPCPVTYNVIGLDYKQQGMYVDSNGMCANYPGYLRAGKAKLEALKRAANQHKAGSSRWLKLMRRADKLEIHLDNQRKDWQYKQAATLADNNSAVSIETLDFDAMKQANPLLEPRITDNNYNGFTKILGKKLEQQGKPLVKVSQYYPSSQICSICGYRFGKLPLWQRTVVCPCCGTVIDRDYNAACNIRDEGIRILNAA